VSSHVIISLNVPSHECQVLFVPSHIFIYNQWMKKTPMTPTERKRAERERKKALGLAQYTLWSHPDDWPKIREYADKLKACRLKDG